MKTPLFTVSIIACDVAPFLDKCIDSVLEQSYSDDFEVVIGVEESRDDTLAIAESRAAADSRIRVEKGARSGSASRTRNRAIDSAKGNYILFVDGDDWIEKDTLEKFRVKIEEFGPLDIIPAAASIFTEKTNAAPEKIGDIFCGNYPDSMMSGVQYLSEVCPIDRLRTATWMNAYRVDFLRAENLKQPDGRRHQDDEWIPRVFCAAKRVAPLRFAYYNYLKRAGSVTTKFNPKSIWDVAENIRSYFDFWRSGKIPDILKPSFAFWYLDQNYYFFTFNGEGDDIAAVQRGAFMRAIGESGQFKTFKDIARFAPPSKKLLVPFYAIARRGSLGFALGRFLYRNVYNTIVYKIWGGLSKLAKKTR